MKCPKCNGRGAVQIAPNVKGLKRCPVCDGSGEVSQILQTNEEWLRSATFEELAGAIYEWYSQGHIEGKVGKQLSSVTRVVEWLKQPHTTTKE